jgi:signal transduction histidine kinase
VADRRSQPGLHDGRWGPTIAPVLAGAVVAVVFAAFGVVAFLYVVYADENSTQLLLGACYLVAVLAVQVLYFNRPATTLRSPKSYAMLALLAALTCLPLLQFGVLWISVPTLLSGTALFVLPRAAAWPVFFAVVAGTSGLFLRWVGANWEFHYWIVASATVGLEVYGLLRLGRLVSELHAAREELAEVVVARERLRFAEELHDLLGLRLSAIVPRTEGALRLLRQAPDRATDEVASIVEASRRALAEVRSVARDYRERSLAEELRAVEAVLTAAGIEVQLNVTDNELPVRERTLFAMVLREAATNVLQHSTATRCQIHIRDEPVGASLEIRNDGVFENASGDPGSDGGLATLAHHAAAAGGEVIGRVDRDGWFSLYSFVPLSRSSTTEDVVRPAATANDLSAGEGIGFAKVLLVTVFCGLFIMGWLRLRELTPDAFTMTVSVGCMLGLLILQICYVSRPGTRLRSRTSYAVLAVQAVLLYLPLLLFGDTWTTGSGRAFVAGSVLLILPPLLAWPAFIAIVLTVAVATAVYIGGAFVVAFNVAGLVLAGLVVYGLTWMLRTLVELEATRRQLAEARVAQERLRYARDLHDLLGLSLSGIALKSEHAQRMVVSDPDRAAEALEEIAATARTTLGDVRSIASGVRELCLLDESRYARSLLAAADIEVQMELHDGELPVPVGTALATVLREGVTNVLRHSSGRACGISMWRHDGDVCLEIVNDGVLPKASATQLGSGIANLSARIEALGGNLRAAQEPDGNFRLQALVPIGPARVADDRQRAR